MIWKPFTLLDKNWQKLFLISFCFVFCVIFLNLFVPFNMNLWENDQGFTQFLRLTKFAAIGISTLAFSQFILRKLFKIKTFKLIEFIGWLILEIVLMALVLSSIYYLGNSFWSFFLECLNYSASGILIPYSIALLIIYIIQLKQKEDTKTDTVKDNPIDLISIPNEKNVIKLSIPTDNLLYFESADNYVLVHYLYEGKNKKKLIRNTLKNLENTLDNTIVKRSHRSYIVNIKSIKLIEKVSGKFFIHIKNTETIIPISTNFIPQFKTYI